MHCLFHVATAAVVKSLFVLGSIPRTASDTVIRFYFNEALVSQPAAIDSDTIAILAHSIDLGFKCGLSQCNVTKQSLLCSVTQLVK